MEENIYEKERERAHRILDGVLDVIIAKNNDYGDSFAITGKAGAATRMFDKAMRLYTIITSGKIKVDDEKDYDTVQDLFAYSIMYLLRFTDKDFTPTVVNSYNTLRNRKNIKRGICQIADSSFIDFILFNSNNTSDAELIELDGVCFAQLIQHYYSSLFLEAFLKELLRYDEKENMQIMEIRETLKRVVEVKKNE